MDNESPEIVNQPDPEFPMPENGQSNAAAPPETAPAADPVAPGPTPLPEPPINIEEPKGHRIFHPSRWLPDRLSRKLGRFSAPVAVLLLVIILGGGSLAAWSLKQHRTAAQQPVERFQVPVAPFGVISTAPAKDAKNVSPNSHITIDFNEPVNPADMQGNFFVTPMVNGKFTQGKSDQEVIFTPDVPFAQSAKVSIMLNGTFQSKNGSKLGANFGYNFTTALPADSVSFQSPANYIFYNVDSAKPNQKQTFQLVMGQDVKTADVTVYKSDMDNLLRALSYTIDSSGYSLNQDNSVDTTGLSVISTKTGLTNQQTLDIQQDTGVYLAVATTGNQQDGYVWIVYSNIGALLRQDDQKVVMVAQNLNDSSNISANAKLYNLNGGLTQLAETSVSGLTTKELPYSEKLDAVVVSAGNDQAFVPVGLPLSMADVRDEQDLANTQMIFGTADKPTYNAGEQVRFAGFARSDNDAQYSQPGAGMLSLYVATGPYADHIADFSVPVAADGSFNGAITSSSDWIKKQTDYTGSNVPFHIYAKSVSANNTYNNDIDVASFMLTTQKAADSNVTLSFGKTSYFPTDQITGTVKVNSTDGQPRAGASVSVHIYSKDFDEADPAANQNSADYQGGDIKGSPFTVKLDSAGQATFNVNVANLPSDGNSQTITAQASYKGANSVSATGGSSTVVHQGDGVLTFGPSRNMILPGKQLISRVYATHLDGSAMNNATINYQFLSDNYDNNGNLVTKLLNSGSVTTDSSGLAEITATYPADVQNAEMDVSTGDAQKNKITAVNYYYAADPNGAYDDSGAMLSDLDISGSKSTVNVGDHIKLNINSPQALNAMVTMDRGRLYNARMVSLNAGDNSFSFEITKDLAPSFTLVFTYFRDGVYHSEGVQFNVNEPDRQAVVMAAPSAQTLSAGSKETVQIAAMDTAGKPLSTNLIVSVVDANAYNLYNQVTPDMSTLFYAPRVLTTTSSSSLTGVGSGGGGKCGGGGGLSVDFANPAGRVLVWNPSLATNSSGKATFNFTPPKGKWRINVYSMSSDSVVGSTTATITAN